MHAMRAYFLRSEWNTCSVSSNVRFRHKPSKISLYTQIPLPVHPPPPKFLSWFSSAMIFVFSYWIVSMNKNKICLVSKVTGLRRHSKGDGGMEGLGGRGFEVPRGPLVTPILKADHSELIVLKLTETCKITGKYSEVYVKGGGVMESMESLKKLVRVYQP